MTARRAAGAAVVLAIGLAVALAAPRLRFTTAITRFLPDDPGRGRARAAGLLLAEGETARTMVIDVEPPAAAAPLLAFLRARPDVAEARSGVSDGDAAAILGFLASFPGSTFVPAAVHDEAGLRARLAELEELLGSPLAFLVRPVVDHDPLGGVFATLTALRRAETRALLDEEGILMSADRAHAFVFVATRPSPFDTEAQTRFRNGLDAWARLSGARLTTAGAAQLAIAGEAQVKGDVQRIGTISTVGTVALFLALFGSLRLIALGLVPMLLGTAVALLVCQAAFGAVHGITLAFGTSLLGLGIDYVEHYYTHVALEPEGDPAATMRSVAPGIALGALTTVIGFAGLAASGVAGLREMALFAVVAIATALVVTLFLVPAWMPRRYRPPRTLARLERGALALLLRLGRRPPTPVARALVVAGALAAVAAGGLAARFSDDPSLLAGGLGVALRDEREVRARLGGEDAATFAVVTSDGDDDALLVALGRATAELAAAQRDGALASFVDLGRLLPDRAEQLRRLAAARAAAPLLRRLMTEAGFVADRFQPYWDGLAAPAPALITLDAVRRSPLGPFVAGFAPRGQTPTILIPLAGVGDPEALAARVPDAFILAPRQTVLALFHGMRTRTLGASGLGLLAIFALLALRYRGPRRAGAALLPATLAGAATVLVLVAAGVPLTILHVMALLLVVSLGVDFGIFFVEKAGTLEGAARSLCSILTAAVTTVLSFGLLGQSANPALAALGITLTLGTAFSVVACLLVAWWLGPARLVVKEAA